MFYGPENWRTTQICSKVFNQWGTSCQILGYSVRFQIYSLCHHQQHQQCRGRFIRVMHNIFNRSPSVFWLKALSRIIKLLRWLPISNEWYYKIYIIFLNVIANKLILLSFLQWSLPTDLLQSILINSVFFWHDGIRKDHANQVWLKP